ncbi:NAD-dependent epimerase/dehydratase family protein [Thermoanaerobacterium sp. CMT5567-10]|uniref:NAD-dependent epimerase/dehydratase family protein n=1 Tax=Thermoanaerobacterium sp. CMT5567-10 TaxID=3061989 RepID=UPI0026DF2EB8|nr:NAD-dependent epimerase/dehydratase family protein [Thermoanaerobacterium sp. CMT5567-10]WKV07996.1 NAD-dependent epimerase/dehydratase family protein [Thermoanaerobacterium sp. CMT5567-10]
MKKILITGANSYIGTSFKNWVSKWPDKYKVDSISVRGSEWKKKSFKGYDVVFHVAAIVHVKEKEIDEYFRVNRDLTVEVAKKAKQEDVKQFIFLSTMGVYGTETGYITKDTVPNPKTPYAKSKYEAEELLFKMNGDTFKVAVLRPPIVYGKGCKGNYPRLARIAIKVPVFPDVDNKRSMIYIDNLCEFIRFLIDDDSNGLFFPQNSEYVNISEMVKLISEANGKKIRITKLFNPILKLLRTSTVNKAFGDLVYEKKMSSYHKHYCLKDFKESIYLTEKRELK